MIKALLLVVLAFLVSCGKPSITPVVYKRAEDVCKVVGGGLKTIHAHPLLGFVANCQDGSIVTFDTPE